MSGRTEKTTQTGPNPTWSTQKPITGDTIACIKPKAAVSAATPNPARPGPHRSTGNGYTFTLSASVQRKLMLIMLAANSSVGMNGTAAVSRMATALIQHTLRRAWITGSPFLIELYDIQPPSSAPKPAQTGGIQAY